MAASQSLGKGSIPRTEIVQKGDGEKRGRERRSEAPKAQCCPPLGGEGWGGIPASQGGLPTPSLLPTDQQSLAQTGKTSNVDDLQVLGQRSQALKTSPGGPRGRVPLL